MQKDFWSWHKIKEQIEAKNRPVFKEREVWWSWAGANIGLEQDGKGEYFMRPLLVFKKFNKETLWTLPVTTKVKHNTFHQSIDLFDGVPRYVNLSQLKLVDAKRLRKKIGTIQEAEHIKIQKAIIGLIG